MSITWEEYRKQNPEYADISDEVLLEHTREKYRPELSSDKFAALVGYAPTAAPENPTEFGITDIGNALQTGYGNAAQGIGWGVEKLGAEDLGKSIQDYWKNYTKEQTAQFSDETKAARAKDMSIDDIGSTLIKIATGATESMPAMIMSMPVGAGIGAALSKSATMLYGAGVGGEAMAYAAGAASPLTTAGKIAGAAPSTIAASVAEGGSAALTNSAQVKASVSEMPMEKLRQTPAFVAIFSQLGDIKDINEREQKTREMMAEAMANDTFLPTLAATSGLGAMFGGGIGGQLLARDAARKAGTEVVEGIGKRTVTGAFGEMAQEAPQSGSDQLISNLRTQEYLDPNQGTWDGVLRQAIEGGLTGSAMGGVFGAMDVQPTDKAGAIHGEIERQRQADYINGITPQADPIAEQQHNAEVAAQANAENGTVESVAPITNATSGEQAVAEAIAIIDEPIVTTEDVAQAKTEQSAEYNQNEALLAEIARARGTPVSPAIASQPIQDQQLAQSTEIPQNAEISPVDMTAPAAQQSMAQPNDASSAITSDGTTAPPNNFSRVAQTNNRAQNVTPLGANHESTIAVKAFERTMQESSETRGTTLEAVAFPVRNLSSPAQPTARDRSWEVTKKLQNLFGKKVSVFRQTGSNGKFQFHGAYWSETDHIYMDVNTQKPAHVVFGHEFLHNLRKNNPSSYRALVSTLRPMIHDVKKFQKDTALPKDMDMDIVEEELVANLVGNRFNEPDFWKEVASKSPSHFEAIAKTVLELLEKIHKALGSHPHMTGDEFITDVSKARTAIAEAVVAHNRANPNNRIDMSAMRMDVPTYSRAEEERDYKLGVERNAREVTKSATLSEKEKLVLPNKEAKAAAVKIRNANPVSKGWAPIEFVGVEKDKPTKPVVKKIPYSFNVPKGETKAPLQGKNQEWQDYVTKKVVSAVAEVMERAKNGDKTAKAILSHASWYRAMATRLRDEFGAFGDVFADLLGATSPNTDVKQNWKYSVDILSRFTRGDFDAKLEALEAHLAAGGTVDNFKKEMPTELITQLHGPKYGMNSDKAMKAILGMWRAIKAGDAPKARNFALNLIGQSDMATIDVWAARFLSRMAGKIRIPIAAESAVAGNWNAEVTYPTGAYGFAAKVMEDASAKLNKMGLDVTAPDLQAVVWFVEKELWTKNNWTTAAGEGGSFEEELDNSAMDRYQAGLSIATKEQVPTDSDMESSAKDINASLKDDNQVVAYRTLPSVGMYAGEEERTFDNEVVAKRGWNPSKWIASVAKKAKEKGQLDAFISRVIQPNEEMANARPAMEIYFKTEQDMKNVIPLLEKITANGLDGFTLAANPINRRQLEKGVDSRKYVGIRLQYVPEIAMRFMDENSADYKALSSGDAAQVGPILQKKRDQIHDAVDEIKSATGVAFAKQYEYDTLVMGKENYDDYTNPAAEGGHNPFGAETSKQPVAERLKGAAERLRGGRESERSGSVLQRKNERSSSPKFARQSSSERLRVSPEEVDAEYGRVNEDATPVIGLHYSMQDRRALSSSAYGTGMKGAEASRVQGNPILSKRIHFYIDEGQGIRPESDVGGHAHAVKLNNLYDVNKDPLGFRRDARGSMNAIEKMSYDAGFDGVYVSGAQGSQGVAVLIGRHTVAPTYLGPHSMAAAGSYVAPVTTLSKGLMSAEIARFEKNGIPDAKSAKLSNGTLKYSPEDADAVDAFLGERKAIPEIVDVKQVPKSLKIRLETEVDGKIVSKTVGAQRALLAAEQNVNRLEKLRGCIG